MMTKPARYFFITIAITLMVFSLPALLVLVVDPFQFAHKLIIKKDSGFDATDRYQNAGLINSYLADPDLKIDTVVIGSSMSQNFPVADMKNKDGAYALKLTLAGGSAKELATILDKAIRTGHVKNVIWEIHVPYAFENPNAMHAHSPLPMFLYNRNPFDDWRYFYNNDVVEESFKLLKGKTFKRQPLDKLYSWENKEFFESFGRKENQKDLAAKLRNGDLPYAAEPPADMDRAFPNIDQHVIPILRAHPDIKFTMYFPPMSYYGYAQKGNGQFWREMGARAYLLEQVKNFPNVQVYAFDFVKGVGDDITQYQDIEHYRPWVSEMMARNMAECRNTITADQWPAYIKRLVRAVNAYGMEFKKMAP